MSFTVIIPARFASTRLPGKALLDICGKPMIQRVFEQAMLSDADRVIVATDDNRIAAAVASFGGDAVMTKTAHPSGTDRLQEVVSRLGFPSDTIIVNVQGDEPLIPPEVINQVAQNLIDFNVEMATLYEVIDNPKDFMDPDVVKLVTSQNDMALYFSRAPIPLGRDCPAGFDEKLIGQYKRHLGIYAYRARLLNEYTTWPVDTIESIEKLEQLRILRRGIPIHVSESVMNMPPGVDTPKDLHRTRALLKDALKR